MKHKLLEVYPMQEEFKDILKKHNIEVINYNNLHTYEEITAIYTHFSLPINVDRYVNCKCVLSPCTSIRAIYTPKYKFFYLDNSEYNYKYVKSTAEHAIFLMLSLCRVLKRDLSNTKVGFIGMGRVARQVSDILEGFTVKKCFYDPFIKAHHHINPVRKQSIEEVFLGSDIVTIHVTDKVCNDNLIKEKHMSLNPNGIILINTARASIVDAEDLINCYHNNNLKGIGVDEIDSYDYKYKNHLKKLSNSHDNLIITDHTAGRSKESRKAVDWYVLHKYLKYIGVD